MKNKNAGFSLIELVVVIAVIVIMAGIGMTWFNNMSGYRARECAGKVASTLTGSKVKALSKQQNTGDAYWELYKVNGKYCVRVVYPNYETGVPYEEISKVAKTSSLTITFDDNTGTGHDADGLRLCYDRSTGALYEMNGNTVCNGAADKNISKISVANGSRHYDIEITAPTGKVKGRY